MGKVEDAQGGEYVREEEVLLEKQAQEDLGEDSDEEDLERFYFFDCVFCKAVFRNNNDHMTLLITLEIVRKIKNIGNYQMMRWLF